VAKRLELRKHHFYTSPDLLNLCIERCFDNLKYLHNSISSSNYKISSTNTCFNFDEYVKSLNHAENCEHIENTESALVYREQLCKLPIDDIRNCANQLFEMSLYQEALECLEIVAEYFKQKFDVKINKVFQAYSSSAIEEEIDLHNSIACNYFLMGRCLTFLKMHKKATQCLEDCIQMFKQTLVKPMDAYYWIGRCFLLKNQPEQALDYLVKSTTTEEVNPPEVLFQSGSHEVDDEDVNLLDHSQNDGHEVDDEDVNLLLLDHSQNEMCKNSSDTVISYNSSYTKIDNAHKFFWIGICYVDMKKFQEAIPYFEKALQIKEQFCPNDLSNETAEILNRLGCCLMNNVKELNTAIKYFERSLQIKEGLSQHISIDNEIAVTNYWLGWCLIKKTNYAQAIDHFRITLRIIKQISVNADVDNDVAEAYYALGFCLQKTKEADLAIENFRKSLLIKTRLSKDANADSAVAHHYHCLGISYFDKRKPTKAIKHFKHSLQIQETISQNTIIDREFGLTIDYISRCLLAKNETQTAITYLRRAIEVYHNALQHEKWARHRSLCDTSMSYAGNCCCIKYFQCYRKICCVNEPMVITAVNCSQNTNICCSYFLFNIIFMVVMFFVFEAIFQSILDSLDY